MFISVLTLYIFVKQTNLMETQNHLSIMPYLLVEASQNGENNTFSIDLVNYGVGPAIIENQVIHFNGSSYEMEIMEFLQQHIPEMQTDSVIVINSSSIMQGVAIPANERRNIITIGGGEKSYNGFLKIFSDIRYQEFDYEVEYKSIYDDHWRINSKKNIPEEQE
ncbi:MAG: hypothetical protein COA49_00410 [Bacteroidetes bacterium]|nr:MAG: hypothetical protein COA49_00410 [Bacteroidota bacterium]